MCLSVSSNVMANMNNSSGTVYDNNDDEIRDRHCIVNNNISDFPPSCLVIMYNNGNVISIQPVSTYSELEYELAKSNPDSYVLVDNNGEESETEE